MGVAEEDVAQVAAAVVAEILERGAVGPHADVARGARPVAGRVGVPTGVRELGLGAVWMCAMRLPNWHFY